MYIIEAWNMQLNVLFVFCLLAVAFCSPQDDLCYGSECLHENECHGDECGSTVLPTDAPQTTLSSYNEPEVITLSEDDPVHAGNDKEFAGGLSRQAQNEVLRPLIPHPDPLRRNWVAFSVRKAKTFMAPTRVEFMEVLTNVGGGWRQSLSHFVAPYRGGYFFTFHAVSETNSEFTLALLRNGLYQVTAYGTRGDYQHGSNSAFLILNRGQRITLQLQEGSIYEHPGREAYTTFTGFLVYIEQRTNSRGFDVAK